VDDLVDVASKPLPNLVPRPCRLERSGMPPVRPLVRPLRPLHELDVGIEHRKLRIDVVAIVGLHQTPHDLGVGLLTLPRHHDHPLSAVGTTSTYASSPPTASAPPS